MDYSTDIKRMDEEYLKSRRWACSKSPAGAHHWINRDKMWICKYCGDVRLHPMNYIEALEFTSRKWAVMTGASKEVKRFVEKQW